MSLAYRRAGRAALVFAAALAAAAAATLPLRAEEGRVVTVQANPELQKRADLLFKGLTTMGAKIKLGSVEAGATPDGLVIKNIEITMPDNKTFNIALVEVRSYDWANDQYPGHMDVSMKGLVIPAESIDKDVAELGLTTITINADFAQRFDDAQKTYELSQLAFDVAELGEIRMRFKLAGLARADLQKLIEGVAKGENKPDQGDDTAMKLFANVNIVSAGLSFKDKSLVARLIRQEAKKKQMTEAAAKAKMLEELAEQRKKAEDDATREVIDIATKFLSNPGLIEVIANPAQPANVMMAFAMIMSNPANLKQLLGVSIAVK